MIPIIVAGAVSLLVALFTTPMLIKFFKVNGYGQKIRIDGPKSHQYKSGTPSMGGIAIILAIWVGYLVAHLVSLLSGGIGFTASGLLLLGLATAFGLVGFTDDFIKLKNDRNLGLTKTGKFVEQLLASLLFGILVLKFPNFHNLTPAKTHISFIRNISWLNMGTIGFLLFCWFIILAWSNAVNFTDGLDGLAAGTMMMSLGSYVFITFWQFRNTCDINTANQISTKCYSVRDPLDLAIVAVAAATACAGFLWWNTAPAKIFMGDTGSLALGSLFAGITILSQTELLALFLGALFLIEMISVVLQIFSFHATGKRIFRMAPIHHHFELSGWAETTVIVRFWLIAGIICALGLAVFYGEFIKV